MRPREPADRPDRPASRFVAIGRLAAAAGIVRIRTISIAWRIARPAGRACRPHELITKITLLRVDRRR
jgi:hypothetical protein